jgi:hypothetical protein
MTAPWQRSWLKSQNSPLTFVGDVLGATAEPWQAEALEAVGKHDRVSISCATPSGPRLPSGTGSCQDL